MNGINDNGERHGPWEDYYTNGNILSKLNYINGKFHGLYESYYSNGKLWYKVNYVNGVEHGLSEWYSNGEFYLKEYYL